MSSTNKEKVEMPNFGILFKNLSPLISYYFIS